MTPDANWPAIPNYASISPADHAAHTTPRGTLRPDELYLPKDGQKMGKELMKFVHKPHLKVNKTPKTRRSVSRPARRKKRH